MPSNISSPRYLPVLVVSLSLFLSLYLKKRTYLRPRARGPNSQQAEISMGPEHLRLKVEFCFKFSSQVAPPQAKDGDLVLACDFEGP